MKINLIIIIFKILQTIDSFEKKKSQNKSETMSFLYSFQLSKIRDKSL